MVIYLLDSDWLIDYLLGRPAATALIAELATRGMAISIITYMETVEGIPGSRDPEASDRIFRRFLIGVPVLGISESIADKAAAIRRDLRRQKRQVNERALDILIAATAIEHGLVLVTRNTRDYADIPGLQLYQES